MVTQPGLAASALIVVGEGFWVLSGAAQLRRLIRTRNTRGLSAVSVALNAAGNLGWCTYFALNHLWYPFVTNIFVFIISLAILGYVLSNRKQFFRGIITIVIVGPITSYVLFHSPSLSGWLGMLYNWIASTPQLLKIIRKKKVSGISEKSLFFATGAMILTLSYALIIHSPPLVSGCLIGLFYMSITMKYYYRHRKHG